MVIKILESKANNKMKVEVWMDFMNAWGQANDSMKIAEFKNMEWAKDFIKSAKQSEDEITKIRVVEK